MFNISNTIISTVLCKMWLIQLHDKSTQSIIGLFEAKESYDDTNILKSGYSFSMS